MKKIYLAILMTISIVLSSCAATTYASQRPVNEIDNISYVLSTYYPELYYYYTEGVLRVNSLKEVTDANGELSYRVRYDFVRYYYRGYTERMAVLQEGFPELYQMYCNGLIEVNTVYKYVDRDTGTIKHHVSYRRVGDRYYYDYPYYNDYYYYRYRRPLIIRPNPPRPAPRPEPRPEPRPNQPNVRPNNPPANPPSRPQANPSPRPQASPGSRGGGNPSSRAGQPRRR